MKRILIFSTAYLPLIGGAELAIKELTERLPGWEFDLICAAIRPGLPKTETIGRVRVHRVGFGAAFDKWLLPVLGWLKAESLHRAAPYDLTWVMMASYASAPALFFKRCHAKIPMLLTLQEGDPPEHIARRIPPGAKGAFRSLFRRADALQTISRFLMDWGRGQGFAGTIAEIIPNGVDLAHFAPRPEARAAGAFTIATASRLVAKNGVDLLIKALAKLPPSAKLIIAGDGELRGELEALAKDLGVAERVTFAGTVPPEKLPDFLSAADVFCRPSRSEGLGTAFIEAMAMRLPIVATPVGGIPDFLRDGENGLSVDPEDAVSLAAALKRLMDDPSLRATLADGAAATAARYTWKEAAERFNTLLQCL